jgi:lysophospholipase L1-like esterase
MPYRRFVALGDSTTEGLMDLYPDGSGYRGWADRLADHIDAADPGLLYANLGIRGRKVDQIRAEQLGPALAMEPDLASVVGGINDMLRPRVDLDDVVEHMRAMVAALSAGGATVLMFTYIDPANIMPVARSASPRTLAYNEKLRAVAAAHGARLIEFERDGVVDPRLWARDRLHANAEGHRRIAAAAAEVLEIPGVEPSWREPLPPAPRLSRRAAAGREVRWAGAHFAPWVGRRLRGRSSGDGVTAKRPTLAPVTGRQPVA